LWLAHTAISSMDRWIGSEPLQWNHAVHLTRKRDCFKFVYLFKTLIYSLHFCLGFVASVHSYFFNGQADRGWTITVKPRCPSKKRMFYFIWSKLISNHCIILLHHKTVDGWYSNNNALHNLGSLFYLTCCTGATTFSVITLRITTFYITIEWSHSAYWRSV